MKQIYQSALDIRCGNIPWDHLMKIERETEGGNTIMLRLMEGLTQIENSEKSFISISYTRQLVRAAQSFLFMQWSRDQDMLLHTVKDQ